MSKQSFNLQGSPLAQGKSRDTQDIAAALLLREVENYLRDGQPRRAIAHICETTGVERDQAGQFVAGLQASILP
jgi:hypothetical protein